MENVKKLDYIFKSLINAAGVFVYVVAIALLLFNGQNIFGKTPTVLTPIFMLLLFIISALVTGSLVLGKPILLYLEGNKKEAVKMFFATSLWILMFLFIVAVILLIVK